MLALLTEETICVILKFCREMLTESPVTSTTLEIFSLLAEIVATFCGQLTSRHVIEIIELCHQQIKEYVLANSTSSLPSRANTFLNANFTSTFSAGSRVSIDDKVLSTILLTAGQACHYYTKHHIVGHASSISSMDHYNYNNRVSQDFIYLLLYLSKKLESKLNFYRDFKSSASSAEKSLVTGNEEQAKGEIFVLIKIYNCFYLKCLHYSLLTLPDAWRYMTTHLMEIVW